MISLALAWIIVTQIKRDASVQFDPIAIMITGIIDAVIVLVAVAFIWG